MSSDERNRPWWDNTLFRFIAVMLVVAALVAVYARVGFW